MQVEKIMQDTLAMMQAAHEQLNRYREMENRLSEPLAIVGMAARLPGSEDLAGFWQSLLNGTDAITEVPAARWSIADYYDPSPDAEDKMYTRYGGFIKDVDLFDAAFFGISPVEALAMDPQQRIILELCWQAFENAGYLPGAIADTGVFVGVSNTEYAGILGAAATDKRALPYYTTGNTLNAIPGRISYAYGFQGPCMAIDTACSSSLVALHTACSSIRKGDCRQAVVGGVNLQLLPANTIAVCRSRMLAADGRCKTFDAAANGYVRGEGAGVIIIKRLSDALADKDRIHALVRGSAVNQDGGGSGFTVPSGNAQERLMRRALEDAGIEPQQVDYLEAHGTGTALGDPIELAAVQAVYGAVNRPFPLWVGAVKTNVGHLEAAAGITGVIKTALALQHRLIPAHLHLQQPSPHIPWSAYHMQIPVGNQAWPDTGQPPRAAVSSFGFSGTNAHVILEAPPAAADEEDLPAPVAGACRFVLSAHSPDALTARIRQYIDWLEAAPAVKLADLCSAALRLDPGKEYRAVFVADAIPDLLRQLRQWIYDNKNAALTQPPAVDRQHISQPAARVFNLPGYPFQRQRFWPVASPAPQTAKDLYTLQYEPVTLPRDKAAHAGAWVLLLEEENACAPFCRLLEQQGVPYLKLVTGDEQDWKRTFQDLGDRFPAQPAGLLDLRNIHPTVQPSADSYQTAAALSARSLAAAKQLHACGNLVKHMIVCTQQGILTGESAARDINVAQGAIGALCKVMAAEMPATRIQHIDLPAVMEAHNWKLLLQCMQHNGRPQLLLRDHGCLAPVLKQRSLALPSRKPIFDKDACYIVTGANGAIGRALIQWMLQNGAARLLLVSRQGFHTPEMQQQLKTFREQGAEITEHLANLADPAAVKEMYAYVTSSMPPLKGIFHAAGITDDELLARQDEKRFRKVMDVKAGALWLLHHLMPPAQLDHFVAFSSSAAWIGFPGQGAYAAANAFMNALMEYRRSLQLPGLSICWGPWNIGMAAHMPQSYWELLAAHGVRPLSADKAFDTMGALLQENAPAVCAVIDGSINTSILEQGINSVVALARPAAGEDAEAWFLDYLRKKMEVIAGIAPARIPAHVSFLSLGLDSLMAIRLQQGIAADTGLHIEIAGLLQGITAGALAAQLAEQYAGTDPAVSEGVPEVQAVDQMSEAEVDTLLRSMLGEK